MDFWPIGEVLKYEGGVHPLVEQLPHYGVVRDKYKSYADNLRARTTIRAAAATDLDLRKRILEKCAADPLYWINLFAWIHEPREGEERTGRIPFITWEHQDPLIAVMFHQFGRRNIVCNKSRAQGATWIACSMLAWALLFKPHCRLGMGSKDMDTADTPGSLGSLGGKVDFILDQLPEWMVPKIERKLGNWRNPANGAQLVAEASTSGIGRADRFTAFFLDESAFFPNGYDRMAVDNLVLCTNGVWMFSTPNGTDNEHYDRIQTPETWLTAILDWKDNPVQKRGMYTSRDGQLVVLDKGYEYPPDYKFILDGWVRSPWFDRKWYEMKRNPIAAARELNLDFGGSKGRPFPKEVLDTQLKYARLPSLVGCLTFSESDPAEWKHTQFHANPAQYLKIWGRLDSDGMLPQGLYTAGVDVASGTGGEQSSNSVISAFDETGEQVIEFACNTILPIDLAKLAVAICYWLGRGTTSTYLNWESNGTTGGQFTGEILRLGYPNVYLYRDIDKKWTKRTNRPGYHTTKRSKPLMVLQSAMANNQITVRSFDLLRECGEYEYGPTDWHHPKSISTLDDSNKGMNHGDRAMGAAMAIVAMREKAMLVDREKDQRKREAAKYSAEWRHQQWLKAKQAKQRASSCVW